MVLCPQGVSNTHIKKIVNALLYLFNPLYRYIYGLVIHFRSGTITDLIRSAPSLPLWKCLGYFVLLAFGIELLVGAPHHLLYACFIVSSISYMITDYKPTAHLLLLYLCCPQVVSFFHRAMLTVGLAVLSLWPFLCGLFDRAKVTTQPHPEFF